MRNVSELTQNELDELRCRWFSQHEDDGSLEEVLGDLYPCNEEDIDMSLIKTYYEDTYFAEEDFFCNI
jgi:hypothetical protein